MLSCVCVGLRNTGLAIILLASAALAAERPNVVMIISDDQGWTDFGFMGNKEIATPHLDRLAQRSVVFPNGNVVTPLCRASLSCMITGLYPHQNGIFSNDPPKDVDRNVMLPRLGNAQTIPRMLQKAGYKSLQTGKFWEGPYSNGGFTHGMSINKSGGRHGDQGLKIGRDTMKPIYNFIEECGTDPFFIWYAPMMPHNPHNPPERLLEKYAVEGRHKQVALYYAMCEWFDETCGQLLDHLDEKGLRDNTLIVFIVDNGWIQDTSPSSADRSNPVRSKLTPYDGGLRTPIMLSWPGRIKPAKQMELVSSLDLAPTVLAACGVEPSPRMTGVNLVDVLTGKKSLDREAVFGEVFVHTAVNLIDPAASLSHRWVREKDFKLIWPVDSQQAAELYNVAEDPAETKNIAAAKPETVDHLKRMIEKWWTESGGDVKLPPL